MDLASPKKLPLSRNRSQFSCLWGLADMFDFRNGGVNQKLLSHGRGMHKLRGSADGEHLSVAGKQDSIFEKGQDIEDGCKLKVKDVMQEEFLTERQLKKLLKQIKHQRMISEFGCVQQMDKDQNATKTSQKASKWPIIRRNEKTQCSRADESALDSHNFAALLEEIALQIHQEGGCNGDIPRSISPSRFKHPDEISLQLLQMSAKAFIDQIYINRRFINRAASIGKSKTFSDASEILHLNKDLFIKLLQDPNSLLLKDIQNVKYPKGEKKHRNKLLLVSKSSEDQIYAARTNEGPEFSMRIQKKNMNNHLWGKLKNRYRFSFKGSTCSTANDVAVLKSTSKNKKRPENVSCHLSTKDEQNIKSTHFSFKEIKRKFKQAVAEGSKEQHLDSVKKGVLSCGRYSLKYADMGISHRFSNRSSTLPTESNRMEKHQNPTGMLSQNGHEIECNNLSITMKLKPTTSSCSKKHEFDILMEAKRHLSARLESVKSVEILPLKQAPRTLEMVLSLPHSPRRDTSASVSAQMRTSVYSNLENGNGISCQSLQKQCKEGSTSTDFRSDDPLMTKPNLPENTKASNGEHEHLCAAGDDLKHGDHTSSAEQDESMLPDTLNIAEIPCDRKIVDLSCSERSFETSESSQDNGDEECSSLADSSSTLDISALQTLDSCKTRDGYPSPISVLEPFSSEDSHSPKSIAPEPAGSPLQPRHIDFDDHSHVEPTDDPKIDVASFMEGDDYISAYVRAVMQASELRFEDLCATGPAHLHALDSYLFNNAGLFKIGSNYDLNLLLDCIHEVLVGVYYRYFGCSSWLSFLKPNIRPFPPLEANVVEKVAKVVSNYLVPEMGQPTMHQLVGKDMAKSGVSWLELRPDIDHILFQIAEDVLQDSMVDAILEFQL